MLERVWVVIALSLAIGCGDTPTAGVAVVSAPDSLPVLGQVPPFELLDQSGEPFGAESLTGDYWVANFIFTRCANMCPILSQNMVELQRRLGTDHADIPVRLVSYSVDPDHDTPAVLSSYAERYGAKTGDWTFATGTREAIWELSAKGFKLAVGGEPGDAAAPLFHTDKFVLVDREGRIRGYYGALDAGGVDSLLSDIVELSRLDRSTDGRIETSAVH